MLPVYSILKYPIRNSDMKIQPIVASATFCLTGLMALAQQGRKADLPPPQTYRRAVIHQEGAEPSIRFSSGLTVCDEALRDGHWVSRYWLSTGMIKPENHLENERPSLQGLPLDAFELSMEGQDLAGTWKWVKAGQTEVHNPDGLLVTLELASTARSVSVKVNTLLHGGAVMIRWLDITNTGSKATAICKVSPWSGMLWSSPGFVERLPPGKEPFEVGYIQYEQWGQEGAWRFDSVVNATKTISGTTGKSGWGHPTFFAKNNATGEWFVGSLGWSSNWTMQLTAQQDRTKNQARLFMIDAGWYGPSPNSWPNNVGDWYAGKWLPNDITPIREYARKKGMLFGLWMEPESVGKAATLRQKHPDWLLTRNGQPVGERALDVANPEVAAWMESEIARLIQKYDLDMFRIDYNTGIGQGGNRMKDGFLENTEWRHVENLYAMFDRLRARFPNVLFQNCAGGGGRLDLGILRRFHNTELSDSMRVP